MEAEDRVKVSQDVIGIKNKLWNADAESDELINRVIEISFRAGREEGYERGWDDANKCDRKQRA